MSNIQTTQDKQLPPMDNLTEAKENVNRRIVQFSAAATHNVTAEEFDMEKAKQKSNETLLALDAKDGLQSMLVAQMLSIHELQQRSMAYAHLYDSLELKKYYTNTAVKLSNCFMQQANILAKLQGVGGQKIIVEHVDVHEGGQAIVGTIQGRGGIREKI